MSVSDVELEGKRAKLQFLVQKVQSLLEKVKALEGTENFGKIKNAYDSTKLDLQVLQIRDLIQKLEEWSKVEDTLKKCEDFIRTLEDILSDPLRREILALILNNLQGIDISPEKRLEEWFWNSLKEEKIEENLEKLRTQANSMSLVAKRQEIEAGFFPQVKEVMTLSLGKLLSKKETGENLLSWLQETTRALENAKSLSKVLQEVIELASKEASSPSKELFHAFVLSVRKAIDDIEIKKLELTDISKQWGQLNSTVETEWKTFKETSKIAAERYKKVSLKAQSLALNEIVNSKPERIEKVKELAIDLGEKLADIATLEPNVAKISQTYEKISSLDHTRFDEKLSSLMEEFDKLTQKASQLKEVSTLKDYLKSLKDLIQSFNSWVNEKVDSFVKNWKERLEKWANKIAPKFKVTLQPQIKEGYSQLLSLLSNLVDNISQIIQNYLIGQELIEKIKEEIRREGKLSKEAVQIYEILIEERNLDFSKLEGKLGEKLDEKFLTALLELNELDLVQTSTTIT